MKVVVCYKCVPEEEEIVVKADQTLDTGSAQWKIGQYDLNAIEAGLDLLKQTEGELLALTAGGEIVENSKLRKAVLSRGPGEMYSIRGEALEGADSLATAQVLKAGIEKIGGVDLVLCGEGSGDIYAQQVGPAVGALLGWPTVNSVSGITPGDGTLTVERSLEHSVEVLEVDLPAVLCVTTDLNIPHIPNMKDIMGAGKKPFTAWSLEEVAPEPDKGAETVSILAPEQTDRLQVILEDAGEENLEAFYQQLRKAL